MAAAGARHNRSCFLACRCTRNLSDIFQHCIPNLKSNLPQKFTKRNFDEKSLLPGNMEEGKEEKLLILEQTKSVDLSGRLNGELQQLKSTYKRLKQEILYEWTKQLLLQTLQAGETPDLAECEREYREKRNAVSDAKSRLQDVISSLRELAEQAETCHKEYEERMAVLDAEKVQYAELMRRREVASERLKDTATRTSLNNTIKQREAQLADLQASLEEMVASVGRLEGEVRAGRAENAALKGALRGLETDLRAQTDALSAAQDDRARQIKWLEEHLSFLRELSGIRRIESEANRLRVWLSPPAELPDAGELCVAMEFVADRRDGVRLKTAQVIGCALDVDDVIREAALRDDAAHLLWEVKERWRQQYPLHAEIERLRQQFSLDWIPDERLLRVINEKNVHVIATLHVARSYPAPGSVTLRRLEGFPAAEGARTAAETLRPPPGEGGADPTLEIWLNFLNEQFRTTC